MNKLQENGNVLLIGGNLVCGTIYKRNLLPKASVSSALLGNSPFSLACTKQRESAYDGAEDIRIDLENGLEAYLENHPAEYVVLDLHYVCQPLVACDESYFTKFPELKLVDYGKGSKYIKLDDVSKEQRRQLIESYADTLLKYFPAKNIALVNTIKSEFYAVKNRLRTQSFMETNQFIGECEQWFQKRTDCVVIDTLKFYYMEKKETGMQYEDEAYLDLADNVKRFIRQRHVRRRPIFRYSLDRYCRYYDNLYKRAFGSFLRVNNAVENLVYSSEPRFVQENYELLRFADKLLMPSYIDVADNLDMTMKNAPMMREILLAMDAAIKKDFVNPNIHYELLFENHITVRSLCQDVRKYAAKHWKEMFPEQITEVNYGYYFALMQLQMTSNKAICTRATQIIQRMQADETIELLPPAVDLCGSCVSRLNLQYDTIARQEKMVIRANLFQALPLFLDGPTVQYNKKFFAPPITSDNKVVQLELDNGIKDALNVTGTKWVVLDLYTLTARSLYKYQGKVYCDNQNFCSRKLGAKRVDLFKEFTQEQILEQLDALAEYLNSRYGDQIILIKHKRMLHYLDFQGKITAFSEQECMDNKERNSYSDVYSEYLAQKTGCYYIDIVDQFLADEMNLLYLNSLHYENEFYDEVQRMMRYILAEHPTQRHFTTYGNGTRVKRIAKLNRFNPNNGIVKALFHDNWLDDVLLRLDPDFLDAHVEQFARIYDECYASSDEACKKFVCPGSETVLDVIKNVTTK